MFPMRLVVGEDLCATPQIFYYASKIDFVDVPLYHYIRYNTQSLTASNKHRKLSDMTFAAMKVLQSFFSDKEECYQEAVLLGLAQMHMWWIYNYRGDIQKHHIAKLKDATNLHVYVSSLPLKFRLCYFFVMHHLRWLWNLLFDGYATARKIMKRGK